MKKLVQVVVLGIIVNTSVIAQSKIEQQITPQFGNTLKCEIKSGGNVKISGWDNNEVLVKMFDGKKKIAGFNLNVEATDYGVLVQTTSISEKIKSCGSHIYVEVFVPKKFNVELFSKAGNVDINNLNGELDGKTNAGNIYLANSNVKGKIIARAGNINAINNNGNMEIVAWAGNINVDMFTGSLVSSSNVGNVKCKDVFGELDAKAGTGNVNTLNCNGKVKANTRLGNVTYSSVDQQSSIKQVADLASGFGKVNIKVPDNYKNFYVTKVENYNKKGFMTGKDVTTVESMKNKNTSSQMALHQSK